MQAFSVTHAWQTQQPQVNPMQSQQSLNDAFPVTPGTMRSECCIAARAPEGSVTQQPTSTCSHMCADWSGRLVWLNAMTNPFTSYASLL